VAQALRDELEAILRGWNAYEVARGAKPVIDFDLRPDLSETVPIESRLEGYHRCLDLLGRRSRRWSFAGRLLRSAGPFRRGRR